MIFKISKIALKCKKQKLNKKTIKISQWEITIFFRYEKGRPEQQNLVLKFKLRVYLVVKERPLASK